jgi:hypothetical protein
MHVLGINLDLEIPAQKQEMSVGIVENVVLLTSFKFIFQKLLVRI